MPSSIRNPRQCLMCMDRLTYGTNPLCQDCDPRLQKERASVATKYALSMGTLREHGNRKRIEERYH